jgi:hypothetical protein
VEGIGAPAEGGKQLLQNVEGIETPMEGGRNRNSCRRWKEQKLQQKVEAIGAPAVGVLV